MNTQPPVTMVAAIPAEYIKRNSRFFVRDGAEMLTAEQTVSHQRDIEHCADEMAQSNDYQPFDAKREMLMALGTCATNNLIYLVAQASVMAD